MSVLVGQLLGNVAGTALAVVVMVLLPPGQPFWLGFLLGVSLSLFGGFVGRMAWQR
jgi:hypothetical protein